MSLAQAAEQDLAREREGPALLPAVLVALVCFMVIRGPASLDPTNIRWLDGGDRAMHTLGWWFFRAAPWGWPPGASPLYGIELANSVALVDALPLLAIPFKLFGEHLPEFFQFWGWWHLLCFVLQAVFAVLIAHELRLSRPLALLAAILCVFSPAFLARLDVHLALSGHWVILAAIWLYVKAEPPRAHAWPVLLGVVSAIHGYLLVMVFAVWCASLVQRIWLGAINRRSAILEGVLAGATIFAVLWACGITMAGSVESFGFGRWRMNLLGPFNPDFWSLVLPRVPTSEDEWEGANYLGAGLIAMAALTLAGPGIRSLGKLATARWLPLAAVAIGLGIFALSNKVALGSIELFTIPLPERLEQFLTTFRSSGRMFWPLGYLIIFGTLVIAARRFSPRWALALCAVATFAQVIDEQRGWRGMYVGEARSGTYWRTSLTSPVWAALAPHYQRVRSVPVKNDADGWRELSLYAVQHHMATASVYLGRLDPRIEAEERARGEAMLRSGDFDRGAIYSLSQRAALAAMTHLEPGDLLALVDGHVVFARGGKAILDAAGIEVPPYHRPRATGG